MGLINKIETRVQNLLIINVQLHIYIELCDEINTSIPSMYIYVTLKIRGVKYHHNLIVKKGEITSIYLKHNYLNMYNLLYVHCHFVFTPCFQSSFFVLL